MKKKKISNKSSADVVVIKEFLAISISLGVHHPSVFVNFLTFYSRLEIQKVKYIFRLKKLTIYTSDYICLIELKVKF